MATVNKLRVVTDYEKIPEEIQEQVKLAYPYGFSQHLITFKNREGKNIKGLRFETDEKIYLLRMTIARAEDIIEQDDDYDEDGNLADDVKADYKEKYIEGLDEDDEATTEELDEDDLQDPDSEDTDDDF